MTPFRRSSHADDLLELIEEAAGNAARAGRLLSEMLAGYPERSELARDILLCEQEGDRITHDILHRLNAGGRRRPLEHGDVHALASALDDIVDYTEETADTIGLYGVEAPMEQAEQLAEVLVRSGGAVATACSTLREGGELSGRLVEIHQLENEGDRISREAIASLFRGGVDPMVVIRWKDIFESLEQAIDSCETVAHVLEGISLKNGRRR